MATGSTGSSYTLCMTCDAKTAHVPWENADVALDAWMAAHGWRWLPKREGRRSRTAICSACVCDILALGAPSTHEASDPEEVAAAIRASDSAPLYAGTETRIARGVR